MKHLLLLCLSLIVVKYGQAQNDFMYSGGLSLLIGSANINTQVQDPNTGAISTQTNQVSAGGYGVTFHPRYNLMQNDNYSIGVGAPLTLGLSGDFNSQSGGSFSFLLDLPLTVDLNLGHGSTKDNDDKFGGFFGLGIEHFTSSYSDSYGDAGTANATGILFHGGIRTAISDKSLTLRLSYSVGVSKPAYNVFGIGLLYNFGMDN